MEGWGSNCALRLGGAFFSNVHWVRGRSGTREDQMGLVGNEPFDGLALGKLHGLNTPFLMHFGRIDSY